MTGKIAPITKCRSCKSPKITTILSLGNIALSDFADNDIKPPKYPLVLVLCTKCFLVQLKHTTPSSLLYTEHYGYKSGINQTMKDELKGIAEESLKILDSDRKKIIAIDIGANDGTLLKYYPSYVKKIGVEPVKKLAKECKQYADIVINDFFRYETANKTLKTKKADIISAISCFYDMEDPNEFVADVVKCLNVNGIFVIQQNYLVKMLTQNAFDNIVHEHIEYYSLISLQHLLDRHGLEVFHLELRELNGGSFRTYIARKGERTISTAVYEQFELEKLINLNRKKVYADFSKKIKQNKKQVQKFLKEQRTQNKSVYLYGASTRGNTLLQYFGIDKKLIPYAVERNPEKWGKKIASVGIEIISEEQARKEKPDYMLVLPWFFKQEFIRRERKYLENGGHFIFPLPILEVI
ncbi:MAG: methyltransferase domain-containing protein [Candidatus Levybacteria bacterium]|nr:methyltransferase domain-containing protein [Candidatus Levybacteria bacterium]